MFAMFSRILLSGPKCLCDSFDSNFVYSELSSIYTFSSSSVLLPFSSLLQIKWENCNLLMMCNNGCLPGPDIKRFCLTFRLIQILFYYFNTANLHKTESAISLIEQFITHLNESNKNLL